MRSPDVAFCRGIFPQGQKRPKKSENSWCYELSFGLQNWAIYFVISTSMKNLSSTAKFRKNFGWSPTSLIGVRDDG